MPSIQIPFEYSDIFVLLEYQTSQLLDIHCILSDPKGVVDDYNITAKAPCGGVLGLNKGVCRDDVTGELNFFQLMTS